MTSATTEGTRANRRREQNRLAQRRFRAKKRNKLGDEEDSNDTSNKRQMRSTRKHPEDERETRSPSYQSETDDHGKELESLFMSPTTQRSFDNGDTFGGSAEIQSYSPIGNGTYAPTDVFTFGDPHATSQLEIDHLLHTDFSVDEFDPENTKTDYYPTGMPGIPVITPVESLPRGIIDYSHQEQSPREEYDSGQKSYRHFTRNSGIHCPVLTSPSLRQLKGSFSTAQSQDQLEKDLMKHFRRYKPPTFTAALSLPLPQQMLQRKESGTGRNQ